MHKLSQNLYIVVSNLVIINMSWYCLVMLPNKTSPGAVMTELKSFIGAGSVFRQVRSSEMGCSYYSLVTYASWYQQSPAPQLIFQQFILANIAKTSEAHVTGYCEWHSLVTSGFPYKGQYHRKRFHAMTSLWSFTYFLMPWFDRHHGRYVTLQDIKLEERGYTLGTL